MSATTLINFLNRAMHVALNPRTNPLTFVFGNEGGDIDSVVSAIYTALLLSNSWEEPTHIPVINFPREDLRLRGDVWTMLRDYGITEQSLLFEEHLHPSTSSNGNTSSSASSGAAAPHSSPSSSSIIQDNDLIVMTDHNVLRGTQKHWASKVVGIIDHHADEHLYDENIAKFAPTAGGIKNIELIGSATSLVALLWKERRFSATSSSAPIPSPILLLCPMVADTGNFKSKKNTPTDEAARDFVIENYILKDQSDYSSAVSSSSSSTKIHRTDAITKIESGFAGGSVSTDRLAKHLAALKEDIRGLTVPETLRRDYKRFDLAGDFAVGISAVLLTKKQCRKLYAVKKADPNDTTVPAGAESDNEDEATADATEDNDIPADSKDGGFPTDTVDWLPAIADRMERNKLNVYMNMFNKKGRELEVVYRSADAAKFEAVWAAFVKSTEETVGLAPKKRFPNGAAFEYSVEEHPSLTCGGSSLKQIVYRQHKTNVSRKNFTPFLVDHFKAFFAAQEQKSDL